MAVKAEGMAKVSTDFIVRDSKISILLILRLFALTYFILQLVLLWHTGGNVFKLVLALFAYLLLFSLFKEWQFSPTKKALHIFTGLSLLERGLYTSSFKAFPYAPIKQLAVKSWQQIINKADIASIVLTWHWYSRYWKHCTPSKNASIRALEIQLTNGQYISISTVNCPPLMVSLFRQGYAIAVQQIDNPWRKWFVPGGVIFVLMLTVVIAQGIYQADYFPLNQS